MLGELDKIFQYNKPVLQFFLSLLSSVALHRLASLGVSMQWLTYPYYYWTWLDDIDAIFLATRRPQSECVTWGMALGQHKVLVYSETGLIKAKNIFYTCQVLYNAEYDGSIVIPMISTNMYRSVPNIFSHPNYTL